MPPEEVDRQINAAAPVVVAGVLLIIALHKFWKWMPWHPRLRTVAIVVVATVMLGAVVEAADKDPERFALGWVVLGAPCYLLRRWFASAEERAAREQRLRQARGHERRRALPPLPPGQGQHPGGTP